MEKINFMSDLYRWYPADDGEGNISSGIPNKDHRDDMKKLFNKYLTTLQSYRKDSNLNIISNKFKTLKSKSEQYEKYILQKAKIYDEYQKKKTNSDKVDFLTTFYFTGSTEGGLLQQNDISTFIKNMEPRSCFVFLASSENFRKLLKTKKVQTGITMSATELEQQLKKVDDKLKEELHKNKKKDKKEYRNEVFKLFLKEQEIDLNMQWSTFTKNVKNSLRENKVIFYDKKEVYTEQSNGQTIIKMGNVQIGHFDTLTVNWEEYKEAIESAISGISGTLNFINFKINISGENLDQLKTKAIKFVEKKEQGLNEFITKEGKFLVELSSLGGSLGEITAGLGLKNFGLDTQLTGTSKNEKGHQSVSDIQLNNIFGANVKHYNQNKPLYTPDGNGIYRTFGDSIKDYIDKEHLIAMRFIELNYDYASEVLGINNLPKQQKMETTYTTIGFANLNHFIRESSLSELSMTNVFYIYNNLVIPTSLIYELILNVLETYSIKKINQKILSAHFQEIPMPPISHSPKNDLSKYKINNLMSEDITSNSYIQFKGFKLDIKELLNK